jgi:RNA polymerase sigma-70 factor (ECF subfamily)
VTELGQTPTQGPVQVPPTEREAIGAGLYTTWEAVYRENVVAVYRLLFRHVGNQQDAEDLTEEVFLAALPRLRLPSRVREVRGYLAACVRTAAADHWRRHYAAPPGLPFLDLASSHALEREEGDAAARVSRLLGMLPERMRAILELRFLRGYSVRQAAAELGVTVTNAKVMQHRALKLAAERAREMEP